jgi:hypothetical protein
MGDALVVVTEWKQFRSPDFARTEAVGRHGDLRRPQPVSPDEVEQAGWRITALAAAVRSRQWLS